MSTFTPWGVFVRAWGWDVAPDGAPGDTVSDQFEICTTTCQAGTTGSGAGQFVDFAKGITIDGAGDVYVFESPLAGPPSYRVQKFDSDGNFLLMFGGGVNQGPNNPGNICTAQHMTEGDTCGAGASGTGPGEFSNGSVRNYISYNPLTDTVFVGDVDRVQEFDLDGSFKGEIELAGEFDGKTVNGVAADPLSGDLYLSFASTSNVFRIAPTLATLDGPEDLLDDPLPMVVPVTLAVDVAGSLCAVDEISTIFPAPRVVCFEADGDPVEGMESEDDFPNEPGSIHGLATLPKCPGGAEPGLLFVNFFTGASSYVKAYGSPPICFEDPPLAPPDIKAQYAVAVETEEAVVRAQINPNFWPDATYYVQYGTGECSQGGCTQEKPLPPGASLTTESIRAPITTAGVFLTGLEPDTVYHYRFVAQSSGGGPVFGIDPDGDGDEKEASAEEGLEATFRTFPHEEAQPPCPNEELRIGPAKRLPDCRAYEMVSPLDKNNTDIVVQLTLSGYPPSVSQSASSGEGFAYSASGTPFGGPEGSPIVSQYLAWRGASGWVSEALAPPRTRPLVPELYSDNEFKAFSEDLCSTWLRTEFDPPLAPGAVPELRNLYRRDNCGGGFEALSTAAPPHIVPKVEESYEALQFQGAAQDSRHSIFVAPDNLPGTEAPENKDKRLQLYEHMPNGELRFVCILPNGTASKQACYAGTADENLGGRGREGSFQNAISRDGERIFWTESSGDGPGKIFVRVAGEAASRRVSQAATGAAARFWGASPEGSRAIFAIEDGASAQHENLYSFDVDGDQETLIAGGVKGVLGVSDDARRVYFDSTKALPGVGPNSEGDLPQAGQHNVYLYEEGAAGGEPTYSFVATLATGDVNQISRPISANPFFRTSRVTPDGRHLAFMSIASLTGYDSTDAFSGEADAQVFLYEAPETQLRCVSCNRSGARPHGIDRSTVFSKQGNGKLWQAAQIPTWERAFYGSRLLSDDGNRLFFESWDALAPRDANGAKDVYQWEAPGSGSCDEADTSFDEEAGGCVELISSGESPQGSSFLDADPSGANVFFTTLSSLVPVDYGLVDVYDARVEGGYAYPAPPPPCEGEVCQLAPPPPEEPTPASASGQGAGDVEPKRACPKGKRRVVRAGKARCVKKQKKKGKRAHRQRRAGR